MTAVDGEQGVSVGAGLRRLMVELDAQAYLVAADFSPLGEAVVLEATRAKTALQAAADQVYSLLRAIERTPEYKRALKDTK